MVAAGVWLVVRGAYDPLLCWATERLARVYEWPRAAQIVLDGDLVRLGRTDLRADSGRLELSITQITFNLVPFLALVLALPGWWARGGIRRLGAGLAIMLASHILALLWKLKCFYAFSLGAWSRANYSDLARNVYGGLRYFFDIPVTFTLPLVLWVGLFWRELSALLDFETNSDSSCGSPRQRDSLG